MSLSSSRSPLLRATLLCIAIGCAALTTGSVRADLPPEPGFKYVPFEFTVTGLSAAPGYVMLAFPTSLSDGAPTSELTVVKDGTPVRLGRRSPTPKLYLMDKLAFESWRAAHPMPPRAETDDAAKALVASPHVVACDAVIQNEYALPTWRPERVIQQTFALVDGRGESCTTRLVSMTEPAEAAGQGGCAIGGDADARTAGGIILLLALGAVVLVRRRKGSHDE